MEAGRGPCKWPARQRGTDTFKSGQGCCTGEGRASPGPVVHPAVGGADGCDGWGDKKGVTPCCLPRNSAGSGGFTQGSL